MVMSDKGLSCRLHSVNVFPVFRLPEEKEAKRTKKNDPTAQRTEKKRKERNEFLQ